MRVRFSESHCFHYLKLSHGGPRRLSVRLLHRIESFEFDACIRRAELPVDRADSLVPMILPTLNLLTEFLNSCNVVGQALPRQHTQFDLGDIEPGSHVWGCNGSPGGRSALWPVPAEALHRKKPACAY